MPFTGGSFSLYTPGNPVVTGTTISSTWANNTLSDIATGLSTTILKNGNQTLTANIPFGGFKITGLGNATALTDGANLYNVQVGGTTYLTGVAGTNTITATATPTPAYVVGQRFTFIPANTNTGATTLNISSVGAGAVQWKGAALVGGELVANLPVTVLVTATTPVFEIVTGRIAPQADVAAHATTSNVWVADQVVLTGGAVTFTDIADAPYVGAVVWVKQQGANVWTNGATFNVQGNANYTAAADDWVRIYATTVSTFEVTVFKADGTPVGGMSTGSFTASLTGCDAGVTGTANYSINGNVVTLDLPALSGTSNTTAATITGLPAAIQPVSTKSFFLSVQNNGSVANQVGTLSGGTITLYVNFNATGFTASNAKGIGGALGTGGSITYTLA